MEMKYCHSCGDELGRLATWTNCPECEAWERCNEGIAALSELVELGYELSSYAASIRWDGQENTKEWLEGLEERINTLQEKYAQQQGSKRPMARSTE